MEKTEKMEREEWRQGLADLSSMERKEIVEHLSINESTLRRWISGTSSPQNAQIVRNLASIVPKLEAALHQAFPDAFVVVLDAPETDQIPSSYHEEFASALATTADYVSAYALSNLLYEQMVSQLDPGGSGLMILPVYCVPPNNDSAPVTKLRTVSAGYGTGPWKIKQVKQPFFLGKNSLSGVAVERGHPVFCPQDYAQLYHPNLLEDLKQIHSSAALPLLRRGRIAGTLFLASTKREFFTTARKKLVAKYTDKFAMSLRDSQFYDRIQLETLPEQQEEALQQFSCLLANFARDHKGLSAQELEERAIHIIREYYSAEER